MMVTKQKQEDRLPTAERAYGDGGAWLSEMQE